MYDTIFRFETADEAELTHINCVQGGIEECRHCSSSHIYFCIDAEMFEPYFDFWQCNSHPVVLKQKKIVLRWEKTRYNKQFYSQWHQISNTTNFYHLTA